MPLKLPKIVGHRGACGYAPENTLESIHTAADMGVEWVELDVKLTKDGIPIIFHDDTLDRTTNGSGNVADHTYEELKDLECGSWFSESFAGIKIPTLEEALEVIVELGLGLNLEIKPCPKRDKETAEIALDVLSRIWDDHDNLLISSFSHICLGVAQDMAQDWHRGLLLDGEEIPENWKELLEYFDAATLNLSTTLVNQSTVEEAHEMDKPVIVYTVNDSTLARELQYIGVDAVFTDVPDVVEDGILTIH